MGLELEINVGTWSKKHGDRKLDYTERFELVERESLSPEVVFLTSSLQKIKVQCKSLKKYIMCSYLNLISFSWCFAFYHHYLIIIETRCEELILQNVLISWPILHEIIHRFCKMLQKFGLLHEIIQRFCKMP